MSPRIPGRSNFTDMSLARTGQHRGFGSDPNLHIPSSPQFSERSGDEDNVFIKPRRRISFDERVSVREFESDSWISVKDMELSPLCNSRGRQVITVPKVIVCPKDSDQGYPDDDMDSVSSGSHLPLLPALHSSESNAPISLQRLLQREVRTILMVDPHDIFLTLFSKRLQEALPHVHILTAHSSQEALQLCAKQTFDVVITEERLSLFHRHRTAKLASGSALLSYLRQHHAHQSQHSLLIGVSAHWQSDHATMLQSGADFCWSKAPPPTLHRPLLEEMMHKLLMKRGKHELAKELSMSTSVASGAGEAGDHQKQ